MTAPAVRPGRHLRTTVRPTWRRRADPLLAGLLGGLLAATAAVLWLVTVPVIGSGQALVREPATPGDQQPVLVVLTGDQARDVGVGTRVSVVWGTGSDRADGSVRAVRGPGPAADVLTPYGLPVQLAPGGDVLVAEADLDPVPDARPGLSGTATAYVGRRPLFALFVGRGVER